MRTLSAPQNISNEILHLLTREENASFIDRIAEKYTFNEEHVFRLSALIGCAISGTLALGELAKALEEELPIGEKLSREIVLRILLELLYPYWPLFPQIDEAIANLGGTVPMEKPAMPRIGEPGGAEESMAYPTVIMAKKEEPELFGGDFEIPAPPVPCGAQQSTIGKQRAAALERDVPWSPQQKSDVTRYALPVTSAKTVAKPGDVARLLDANILKKPPEAEPKIIGNVVDLSN